MVSEESAMTLDELAQQFPRLYHMAERGTWPSIRERGLLSTSALLDLFEVKGKDRDAIESCRRPECVHLSHPTHGTAVIRDQKPMSDSALRKCLIGMAPDQWYETLNRRVFFWLCQKRLMSLLCARAYRGKEHCVLTVDTRRLVEAHLSRVTLSPINSGSTVYRPQPRGPGTFLSLEMYPFDLWRAKRGVRAAVVELAVDYAVPNICTFVVDVAHMKEDVLTERLSL